MNQQRWNSDSHDSFEIIKPSKIELMANEIKLLNNFQNYTSWASRFLFPRKENEITDMERKGRNA